MPMKESLEEGPVRVTRVLRDWVVKGRISGEVVRVLLIRGVLGKDTPSWSLNRYWYPS